MRSTDTDTFMGQTHVDVCCTPLTGLPLNDTDAERLARIYGAVADPVRLRLLSLIAAAGEMCSCDFLEPLAKSQPTISHHTKVLAEAGLIIGDRRGRWIYWSVPEARADAVRHLVSLGPPDSTTKPPTGGPFGGFVQLEATPRIELG